MAYRDLSRVEQQNVLATLLALRARFGNWLTVERALPISHSQRVEMTSGRAEASTTIAFRIAKLLEVSLHDVLQGLAIRQANVPALREGDLAVGRPGNRTKQKIGVLSPDSIDSDEDHASQENARPAST
jgi:hypothetical protein